MSDGPPSADPLGPVSAGDPDLQFIAEGITSLVGFRSVAINIRRGDDYEVVAVATEPMMSVTGQMQTAEQIVGTRWSSALLADLVEGQTAYGSFVLTSPSEPPEEVGLWWNPEVEPVGPDGWGPFDSLNALIHDEQGTIVGLLSIDQPVSGRRPDAAQLRILDRFAEQARAAILQILERDQLAERARNLADAREFLRRSTADLTIGDVLDASYDALLRGADADHLWIDARGSDGDALFYASPELEWRPSPAQTALALASLARPLTAERTAIFTREQLSENTDIAPYAGVLAEVMDSVAAHSMLVAALGDDTRIGHLVLLRAAGRPPWSPADVRQIQELSRDVTRVVQANNSYLEEKALVEQLRRADRAHNRLIDTVSRELRAPLIQLSEGLQQVRRSERESRPWQRGLAIIEQSGERMVKMIDALLLLSRLSDPSVPPARDPVDLGLVAIGITAPYRSAVQEHEIALDVVTPPTPAVVRGDRTEFGVLVGHLLENAIAATPPHGRVHVEVADSAEDDTVRLMVSDTGVGIPEMATETIFGEFVRGATRGGTGLGLGLTIVERIAERHHGSIEVDSTPGMGSRFRVSFPRSTSD
ncbi:MAG: HAMP domain-containing sensor histidine kinase [Nocardioides sp.]|uniref:sensor histidine kinase n=1 Tax=Nocardioides sp. TaxID=35761 RepID=UPI0039E71B27